MAVLIIHGGAGAQEGDHAGRDRYSRHLADIVARAYAEFSAGGAREAVLTAIRLLEDDPLFNAGTGSKLQSDGEIRMSAALMDSEHRRFSGVINIQQVKNPIVLAELLAREKHTVLAGAEALAYARARGIGFFDPVTDYRLQEYRGKLGASRGMGTVGAVAVDDGGLICAATSTGGVGHEIPGRVSDSATVAGTYASPQAGVSCTGIGEQIVNHAVAARVITRIEDGAPMHEALARTIAEANERGYSYGLICLNRHGEWAALETAAVTTLFACADGARICTFAD